MNSLLIDGVKEAVTEIILNVKEIYCGFNFTFGKNKSGNIKVLDDII